MHLRLLGTNSGHTGCPALYATDRDTYVVQGWTIDDPTTRDELVDVRPGENAIEIPATLADRIAAERAKGAQ